MSHTLVKQDSSEKMPAMIVLHGLLGNKRNWRSICEKEEITSSRDCYLVELRNHVNSDHHSDFSHEAISDDIIRFADKMQLDTFTVLGHSLGGRAAMTTACKNPDRVDGVISVDSPPMDANQSKETKGIVYTRNVIEFMHNLKQQNLTREGALRVAAEHFKGKPEFQALIKNSMDRNSTDLKWTVNIDSMYENFEQVPYFDETLRYDKDTVYHLVGEKSNQYDIKTYNKVFPNLKDENVIVVPGAGHWVHFDKPTETLNHLANFLDDIDYKKNSQTWKYI